MFCFKYQTEKCKQRNRQLEMGLKKLKSYMKFRSLLARQGKRGGMFGSMYLEKLMQGLGEKSGIMFCDCSIVFTVIIFCYQYSGKVI